MGCGWERVSVWGKMEWNGVERKGKSDGKNRATQTKRSVCTVYRLPYTVYRILYAKDYYTLKCSIFAMLLPHLFE